MRRRIVRWAWEDPDAQASFQEWIGFPEADVPAEADAIESALGIRPPLDLLDVGCGTGRHALELARRGYRVVGIDVAASYLDQARQRAQAEGLPIEFRLQRGANLADEDRYDAALAFNHTLGFMSDPELVQHLAAIRRALKPGGAFLLKIAGPRLTPNMDQGPVRNWSEQDGRWILSEKSVVDGVRYERCIVIDTAHDEMIEFQEEQRALSLDQILSLLAAAGWVNVQAWADLRGTTATTTDFCVFLAHRSRG